MRVRLIILLLLLAGPVWLIGVNRCGIAHVERHFEASPMLKRCAALGYARAQAFLGLMYLVDSDKGGTGEKYKLEPAKSAEDARRRGLELMYKAAEKGGGGVAQNEIGLAYLEGSMGFEKDYDNAREWFERGVEAGDYMSAFNLARIYANGWGVEPDLEMAVSYLELSEKRGYCPATKILSSWRDFENKRLESLKSFLTKTYFSECRKDSWREVLSDAFDRRYYRVKQYVRLQLERISLQFKGDREIRKAASPLEAACTVYVDLFRHLREDSGKIFLRPLTVTYRPIIILDSSDEAAPSTFRMPTDETETVEYPEGETYERQVFKEVYVDTSDFFDDVKDDTKYAVINCFDRENDDIAFWSGSIELLDYELSRSDAPDAFVSVWAVSPVGISDAGDYAVLYVTYDCGPLCAAGSYYLLKKDAEGNWEFFGFQDLWVT
jgi:hypothetical protein